MLKIKALESSEWSEEWEAVSRRVEKEIEYAKTELDRIEAGG